ncbi:MAG: hypothetical protein ACFCVD_04655 [Nodosilinea sp.]
MNNPKSQTWSAQRLIQFSDAMAIGYLPGLEAAEQSRQDSWTTQRHLRAAMMRARAYGGGF